MVFPVLKHGLCYFPVPKVACSSIKTAMHSLKYGREFQVSTLPEGRAKTIHRAYPTKPFASIMHSKYTKLRRFAVIRDPIERLVSAYRNRVVFHNDLAANKLAISSEEFSERGLQHVPDLGDFIERLKDYSEASRQLKHHTDPMTRYLGDDLSYFERLFHFSSMSELENWLRDETGVDIKLPHKQTGGPGLTADVLTVRQKEMIREYYQEDYRVFGDLLGSARIVK